MARMEGKQGAYGVLVGNLKGDRLEDLCLNGGVLLK
jgi:hypothetical protein